MTREDQAALLGSECERWLRSDVRAPLWIPSRYGALKPLGASEVLNVLDKRRASPRANGTIGNLYEVRDKMVKRTQDRIEGLLNAKVSDDASSCPCCVGYARAHGSLTHVPKHHCSRPATEATGAASPAEATSVPSTALQPAIKADPPVIDFDQDTWQTTVTESITLDFAANSGSAQSVPAIITERVREVLRNSSPEMWAPTSARFAAPDHAPFFVSSVPGTWTTTGFVADPSGGPPEAWGKPTGGQLEEVTSWSSGFDASSDSGAHIYLTIKNYKNAIGEATPSLEFDYVLHHCESYQAGPLDLGDILDIDGGHFKGSFQNGVLVIQASKSIHFRAPSAAEQDAAILLNLLAPATVAMLMRELVYDGTLKLLNAPGLDPPGPTPRSAYKAAQRPGKQPSLPSVPPASLSPHPQVPLKSDIHGLMKDPRRRANRSNKGSGSRRMGGT